MFLSLSFLTPYFWGGGGGGEGGSSASSNPTNLKTRHGARKKNDCSHWTDFLGTSPCRAGSGHGAPQRPPSSPSAWAPEHARGPRGPPRRRRLDASPSTLVKINGQHQAPAHTRAQRAKGGEVQAGHASEAWAVQGGGNGRDTCEGRAGWLGGAQGGGGVGARARRTSHRSRSARPNVEDREEEVDVDP